MIEFLDPNGTGGVTLASLKQLTDTFSQYTFSKDNRKLNHSQELTGGSVSDNSSRSGVRRKPGTVRSIFGNAIHTAEDISDYASDDSNNNSRPSGWNTADDALNLSEMKNANSSHNNSTSSSASSKVAGISKELELMRINRLHFNRRSPWTKVVDGTVSDSDLNTSKSTKGKKPSSSFLQRVDTMLRTYYYTLLITTA